MKVVKRLARALIAVIMITSLACCGATQAVTSDSFTECMEANGFAVYDTTIFSQDLVSAELVLTALNDEYEINFYEFDCDDTAKELMTLNKDAFESDATNESVVVTQTKSDKHEYYHTVNDSDFCMTARIDNTVIYCYTDQQYIDEIMAVVKELGYK